MKFQHWIDDTPTCDHEDARGRYEVIGQFRSSNGIVQAKVLAQTTDAREWQRIMEAIETLGSLNFGLDNLPKRPDGTLAYGIDLVGHRVEYVFPGR